MRWQISSFPSCRHHVFLSHSQEDRLRLLNPIREKLEAAGVIPWFDQDDYFYGRPSRTALRDGILNSRHTIFFITDAMLNSARGWCVMELTIAELVESNFQVRGATLAHPILPLFLTSQTDERLPRSVWQDLRDQGRFCPTTIDVNPVEWATREILDFLRREEALAKQRETELRRDSKLRDELKQTPGLRERVARFEPPFLK